MSQSTSPLTHQQAQTWLRSQQPLEIDQQSALSQHLATCPHCRGYAGIIHRLETDLPGAMPGRELSEADIQREVRALQAQRRSQSVRGRFNGVFRTAAFVGLFAGLLILIYYVGGQLGLPFNRNFIPGGLEPATETALLASEQVTATPLPPTPPPFTQDMASTGPPTPEPSPALSPPPRVVAWPDAGEVNLRRGPGTTFEVISTAAPGTEFQAIGSSQDGNWIQIEYPDAPTGVAWIYAALVQIGDGGLPVLEGFPTMAPFTANGLPPEPLELVWSAESLSGYPSQSGWLYFVVRPLEPAFSRQLARLPLDCLYASNPCPVEIIPGWPENGDYTLYWSPDGSRAAMADLDNSQLLLFDPSSVSWQLIDAGFPATNDTLLWSPDNAWIASTLQGEDPNSSQVTIISPDGGQKRPLAPELAGYQVPLAWLDSRTLLIETRYQPPKGSGEDGLPPYLYSVDIESGQLQDFQVQPARVGKSGPVFSPDSRRFVIEFPTGADGGLAFPTGADGGLAVIDRADWQALPVGMDGDSVAWSPDGQWLALTRSVEGGQEVHVANPAWKQVFSWPTSTSLLWMPDNQHLLVTGWGYMQTPSTLLLVDTQSGSVRQLLLAGEGPVAETVYASVQPPPQP